jgi:hypothetical protein
MAKKINDSNNKYDWPVAFAQSYILIAKLACQEILSSKPNKHYRGLDKSTYETADLYIPIVFNIKHGIEVFIKSLSIFTDETYDEKTHDIKRLFLDAKPRILKILKPTNKPYYNNVTKEEVEKTKKALDQIEILIDDFYHLDFLKSKIHQNYKFSDIQNDFFRYPENKTLIQIEWRNVLIKLSKEDVEQILIKIEHLYKNFHQAHSTLRKIR